MPNRFWRRLWGDWAHRPTFLAHGATHPGRLRENNEDAFLCDPGRGLFIVCDGMGGHAGGREASRLAIESLSGSLTRKSLQAAAEEGPEHLHTLLKEALAEANRAILERAEREPALRGMGSTVVLAHFDGVGFHLAHLGDSRAYLLRGAMIQQLSRDHTVVADLVERGLLPAAEARDHDLRHQLTGCLGTSWESEPGRRPAVRPALMQQAAEPGDRLLLCSDGLWDMVEEEEIALLAVDHPEPRAIVAALIAAANNAGGEDNITAVVVQVGQDAILPHGGGR